MEVMQNTSHDHHGRHRWPLTSEARLHQQGKKACTVNHICQKTMRLRYLVCQALCKSREPGELLS